MQPGCPSSHVGACPAFQHPSNVDALRSHQHHHVTPAPVAAAANIVKINMVAHQDPRKLGVDVPSQRQQNNAELRFHRLQHYVTSCGFQQPRPADRMWTPQNSGHGPNADIYSPLNVTTQCTSANERSGMYLVNRNGQHKGSFPRGPNLNSNNTEQQRLLHDCLGTTTVATRDDTVDLTAQQHQYSLKQYHSSQQVEAPLKNGNLGSISLVSSLEKTKVNIEPTARTNLSIKMHCQSPQVKCSLGTLNCENPMIRTQTPGYSIEDQQQVTSPSTVLPKRPPTDDEIHKRIAEELEGYKRNENSKRNAHLSDTFASNKARHATGHTLPAYSSGDSRGNADLTWTCGHSTVATATHSTEYPQIMMKVAPTCTNNEDDSPVVLTSTSGMTMIDLTKRKPNYMSAEYINKNMHDAHNVPGISWAPKPIVSTGYDDVHAVIDVSVENRTKPSSVMTGSDTSLYGIQDIIQKKRKNNKDHLCPITDQEVVTHSKMTSSISQIQILNVMSMSGDQIKQLWDLPSCEHVMDSGSVNPHPHFSPEPPERSDKAQESALSHQSQRVGEQTPNILKCPEYEDISDYELIPAMLTGLPYTEHEDLDVLVCHENQQMEKLNAETHLKGPNRKRSQFENDGPFQMKGDNISDDTSREQNCSCPCFVETDTGFQQVLCPKCDRERHFLSCSPDNLSDGFETDEMDDYMVIPLSMTDIKYEPAEEIQDFPGNTVPDDSQSEDIEFQSAPESSTASVPCPIEVFDTIASFILSKRTTVQFPPGRCTPDHEMNSDTGGTHTPRHMIGSRSECEDSSETENSCDYSSEAEHNYLTASRCVFKNRSAPATDQSADEKENEPNKATSVQNGQSKSSVKLGCIQKLKELIKSNARLKGAKSKTNRQRNSKAQGKFFDSDSEDKSDYNCKMKAKRKRLSSSSSVGSPEASYSQQREHPHQTVDSQSPQSGSELHETRFKEVIKTVCSSGQLTKYEADPDHVQHAADRKDIPKDGIIIIDSDTEDSVDTWDESDKKVTKETIISSRLVDDGSAPYFKQKRHPCENVDSRSEPSKEKFQRMETSSVASSVPLHRSKLEDAQFNEGKSGHLLETEDGTEHIQDKTSNTTFNGSDNHIIKKATTDPLLPSLSKVCSRASCSIQNGGLAKEMDCGSGRKTPQKRIRSSYESADRRQSVDQSSSHRNSLIPRLYFIDPADPRDPLKLVKGKPPQRRDKEDTVVTKAPSATSKKMHSSDKNTQDTSLNKTLVNIINPKLLLRHRSLSNQEGQSISRSLLQPGETATISHQSKMYESTNVPKHNLSSSKLRHSFSHPSTSCHPWSNTRDQSLNATSQLSAVERLKDNWSKSYYPTKKDRKTSTETEEASRTLNTESKREAYQPLSHQERAGHHDRPPKQRRNSKESETSLMKRAKMEAVQLTRATNRNNSREQRGSVGEGYKWSERPKVARSNQGDTFQFPPSMVCPMYNHHSFTAAWCSV
uniref:uncharacterized protein LOC122766781 isoform X2 n=1 Tax=Solea senegalensis TaxID=28829 RepID=UPI001CD913AE|nr:uncharacterized protein LOC122766781 isoform X2 [Solea senegalensis]